MSDQRGGRGNRATSPTDPYQRHRFVIWAAGLGELSCSNVSGLEVSVGDRVDQETGVDESGGGLFGRGSVLDRLGGRARPSSRFEQTWPTLQLSRGVEDELPLWHWLQGWLDGSVETRTVTISLLDGTDDPGIGWIAEAARPVGWTGPSLAADDPGVAMEQLELAHEGLSASNDFPDDMTGDSWPFERDDVDWLEG